jgi:hypothetical protein
MIVVIPYTTQKAFQQEGIGYFPPVFFWIGRNKLGILMEELKV